MFIKYNGTTVQFIESNIEEDFDRQDITRVFVNRKNIDGSNLEQGQTEILVVDNESDTATDAHFGGVLRDVDRQGSVLEIVIESFERYARDALPTDGGERWENVDDSTIVQDAISNVSQLSAGTIETVKTPMSKVFSHSSQAKKIRSTAQATGGEVNYKADKTVDYLTRRGQDRTATVLSPSNQNIKGDFKAERLSAEEDITHLRVVGAGEGKHQKTVSFVPDADTTDWETQLDHTVERYTASHWSSGDRVEWATRAAKEETDIDSLTRLGESIINDVQTEYIEASATIEGVSDVKLGDSFTVDYPEEDINSEELRIVELEKVIDKTGVEYDVELSSRRESRDPGEGYQESKDLANYNLAFEGTPVTVTTGGGRQPVDGNNNYQFSFYYPSEVEYVHRAKVQVKGFSYRHYSLPDPHSHTINVGSDAGELDLSHSHSTAGHNHTVVVGDGQGELDLSHSHSTQGHSHTINVGTNTGELDLSHSHSTAGHSHTINVGSNTGELDLSHSHTTTGHSHMIYVGDGTNELDLTHSHSTGGHNHTVEVGTNLGELDLTHSHSTGGHSHSMGVTSTSTLGTGVVDTFDVGTWSAGSDEYFSVDESTSSVLIIVFGETESTVDKRTAVTIDEGSESAGQTMGTEGSQPFTVAMSLDPSQHTTSISLTNESFDADDPLTSADLEGVTVLIAEFTPHQHDVNDTTDSESEVVEEEILTESDTTTSESEVVEQTIITSSESTESASEVVETEIISTSETTAENSEVVEEEIFSTSTTTTEDSEVVEQTILTQSETTESASEVVETEIITTSETTETAQGVDPGIQETGDYPQNADVLVNGNSVGVSLGDGTGSFEETVDIEGMLNTGQQNTIEVTTADGSLGHIQAHVDIDVYRQILGDG